jgi:hypothetical protein
MIRACMKLLPESEKALLGAEIHDLGTHSVRKGASSYAAGVVNGASAMAISQRAGWSLGGVQDRYIFQEVGSDQLCGRIVSGLNFNDTSFLTLPPHFDKEGQKLLPDFLKLYPSINNPYFPSCFKQVIPYLIASLLYHEAWMRSNFSNNHPIFSSPLFTLLSSTQRAELLSHVKVSKNRDNESNMIATGVPTHLIIANEISDLKSDWNNKWENFGKEVTKLPEMVTSNILERAQVNGALPVTSKDMDQFKINIVGITFILLISLFYSSFCVFFVFLSCVEHRFLFTYCFVVGIACAFDL